jgi:hypothetical protein
MRENVVAYFHFKWTKNRGAGQGSVTVSVIAVGVACTEGRPKVAHWRYAATNRSTKGEASRSGVLRRMRMTVNPSR